MVDVPRRLPPSAVKRLRTIADHTAGGSLRGGTAWGKRSGSAAHPSGSTANSFSREAGNAVPLGTGGGDLEDTTFFGDDATIYVAPDGDALLFGAKLDGDDQPRILFSCDSEGGLYLGDGTQGTTDMVNLYLAGSKQLGVAADNGVLFSGGIEVDKQPIVMQSPDGTLWDVTVANGGTLTVSPH